MYMDNDYIAQLTNQFIHKHSTADTFMKQKSLLFKIVLHI